MQNYHVYGPIGKGRFSSVYKGRRKKTIQYYAIKSVEKSQKPSVLQEVRTLHSLEHENILRFYDWYETSNHLWLILEYCVGGDLQNLLRQDKMLPEESIHDFARDILKALQFLHSKSVVYCDLKPSNILLDENGRLKLCDFGLARTLTDISKESVQQLPATKRGTLCYMAPELLEAGAVHSFSSDHWALGCVMYECYAGRPPFDCTSLQPLLSSIINQPPPPLPGNPSREFQDLVFRLLQKDPRQRIQWADLKAHPFWRERMRELPLPEQPAFDKFVQQRLGVQTKAPVPRDRAGGAGSIGGGDTHSGRVALGDVSRMDRNAVPLEVGGGGGEQGEKGWEEPRFPRERFRRTRMRE